MLDPEKIKEELSGSQSAEQQLDAASDPRLSEDYGFSFSYVNGRGKAIVGDFVNRILNTSGHLQVAAIRSKLTGGVPVTSLTQMEFEEAHQIAHMTLSLIQRPKWARNLGELRDRELIAKLYEEVNLHEATFHGREQDQAAGEDGSDLS